MSLIETLLLIFSMIAVGFFCGKRKLFSPVHTEGFELFLFKIAIPCSLFTATLHYQVQALLYLPYIGSYLLTFLFLGSWVGLYFWKQRHSPTSIIIHILASVYLNAAIYSLPIITFLLKDPRGAILSNLIQVILIQSLCVTFLSWIHHREKSLLYRLSASLLSPIVVLPITGLFLNFFDLHPPSLVTTLTGHLGNGASSMALFLFGLTLSSISFHPTLFKKDLLVTLLAKNFLHPIVAFLIGSFIFKLDAYWLRALVIASSAPTGFIVYLIAKQFSHSSESIKMTIALSCVLSLFSLGILSLLFF